MREDVYDTMYRSELKHWWYRGRRKIVRKIVSSHAQKVGTQLRMLDVGCGTGALIGELKQFGGVAGVDISERAVAYCKERGFTDVVLGDAAQVPYPDQSFDVVVILDVLEHLEDDHSGAREIKRVLKPGGIAIVAVPAFMFLWGITDVMGHHYRRYTRPEITRCLRDVNLIVRYASYFNTFLFPLIVAVRLLVRFLRIPMKTEYGVGGNLGNAIFYWIFSLESFFIPYIRFPFGVSVLVLAEKDQLR